LNTFTFFVLRSEGKTRAYPKEMLDTMSIEKDGETVMLDHEQICQDAFGGGRYHTVTLKDFFIAKDDQQIRARLWEGGTYHGEQFNASLMVQAITSWDLDQDYNIDWHPITETHPMLPINMDTIENLSLNIWLLLENYIPGRYYSNDLPATFPTLRTVGGTTS
jgi:hypothetical protein